MNPSLQSQVSTQSLRIAFVTPEFVTEPKFDGGLANYLNRVTHALTKAGHEPHILVATDKDERIDHQGVPVHRIRTFSPTSHRIMRLLRLVTRRPWCATWEAWCTARSIARYFTKLHAAQPFDVVQSSDFQAPGLLLDRRAVSVVTRLSYYAPLWRPAQPPVHVDRRCRERMEAATVTRASSAYAPSRFIAERAGRALGCQIDVLPPPVFVDMGEAMDGLLPLDLKPKTYILFFGRVCWLKGAHVLGPAVSRILVERPDWRLVIVGREDPPGIISEIRRAMGPAGGQLVHMDRLPHRELYPIIRHAAVVCLPSLVDNFPNTCVEAMALGQIVVATRDRGFDELIVDRVSGFLATVHDPVSVESSIRECLDMDPERRHAMERAARASIDRYQPDKVIPPLIDYYRTCIQRHRLQGDGA